MNPKVIAAPIALIAAGCAGVASEAGDAGPHDGGLVADSGSLDSSATMEGSASDVVDAGPSYLGVDRSVTAV
jgi:hypothetical protein